VLCFGFNLQAQGKGDKRFGFFLNPTLSWMTSNDNRIKREGSNLGIKIGTIADFYLGDNFGITTGLGLALNQGGTLRHDIGGKLLGNTDIESVEDGQLPDGTEIKYNLQYIEVPLALKLYTDETNGKQYFVQFPILNLGINVRATGDIEGGSGSDAVMEEDINIRSDVPTFNLSFGLNIGMIIESEGTFNYVVAAGYQRSLTDVTKNDGVKNNGRAEDSKSVFNNFSLTAAMLF
jgi:hypothetical protein